MTDLPRARRAVRPGPQPDWFVLTGLVAACSLLVGCSAHTPRATAEYGSSVATTQAVVAAKARMASLTAPGGPAFEEVWEMFNAGRFAQAEQALAVWVADHGQPDNPRTPKAMFLLGYCREKLDRPEAARRVYRQILGDHGQAAAAGLARDRLKRLGTP